VPLYNDVICCFGMMSCAASGVDLTTVTAERAVCLLFALTYV
jgi:hypothetical protein